MEAFINTSLKIISYGGGGAVVAFLLFKFLGKKWIERQFSASLEKYKHNLNKELEFTRYQISTLFSRVSKIHEKEFEVLSEAWIKMQDAHGKISRVTAIFRESPYLDGMSELELEDFLEKSELPNHVKVGLKKTANKNEYYQDQIVLFELNKAFEALYDFHNYIIKYRIFLSSDIKNEFNKIDSILWEVIIHRKTGLISKEHDYWVKAFKKIRDDVAPVINEIEGLVQKRLHFDDVE